ncbi:hypothetical protein C8R48DRAFT_737769 [Suillus tomentosus]|nr:hypothetical protein C8R48DRAFT_737769 [Suillus tomentosus]
MLPNKPERSLLVLVVMESKFDYNFIQNGFFFGHTKFTLGSSSLSHKRARLHVTSDVPRSIGRFLFLASFIMEV